MSGKLKTCLHLISQGDVTKWKLLPRYWPFVREIQRSPANSPRKGQWRGALMVSMISAWTNSWANNADAGDLRRHRSHNDVTLLISQRLDGVSNQNPPSWKTTRAPSSCIIHDMICWWPSDASFLPSFQICVTESSQDSDCWLNVIKLIKKFPRFTSWRNFNKHYPTANQKVCWNVQHESLYGIFVWIQKFATNDFKMEYFTTFGDPPPPPPPPPPPTHTHTHTHTDAIIGGMALRSPASRLFTQPFIQKQIKQNTKAPPHWPLCGEFIGQRWILRTKGQ